FRTTGALLPSSRFLARALAAPLRRPAARVPAEKPRRVLEVGPGTGSVTRAILRYLRPDDRLDAVELNRRFVDRLQLHLLHDPLFAPYRDQVRVVHSAVEELPGEGVYSHIVSGMP